MKTTNSGALRWLASLNITLLLTLVFGVPTSTQAASGDWNTDSGGLWNVPANWSPAAVPGTAADDVVGLTYNLTADSVITNDTAVTLGTLNIGDADTTHAYTLTNDPGASMTLSVGAGNAAVNQVSGSKGDTIQAALLLNNSLDIANASPNALKIDGGISAAAAGPIVISNIGSGTNVNISGSIGDGSGTVSVVQNPTAASKLILSGANTFSGGLSVQNGSVVVSGTNTFTGGISIASGAALQLETTGSVGDNVIANDGAVLVNLTGTNTVGNLISGSGSLTVSNLNTGVAVILTNVNTFTGDTTIFGNGVGRLLLNSPGVCLAGNITGKGARIELGATNQIADTAIVTFSINTANRLDLQGFDETIGGVQDSGGGNTRIVEAAYDGLASKPATLTLDVAGAGAYGFSGYVRNGTGGGSILSLVKDGPGTQTFSGGTLVTYSGPTTINDGVLEFSGANTVANSSAITVNSSGIMKFSGGGTRSSALISGAGNVIKAGANTLILSVANTYTGNTTNTAGTLTLGNVNAVGTGTLAMETGTVLSSSANLTTGNGGNGVTNAIQLAGDCTVSNLNDTKLSGVISGPGALTKMGASAQTLTLSGDNTYTGGTTIGSGFLSIATIANGGVSSPLGAATSDAANLVIAGGTLSYTGPTASSDRNFTLNNIASNTTAAVSVTAAATTLTLSGTAPSTTGFLLKTGAGGLTLDPGAGSFSLTSITLNGGVMTLKSGTFNTTGIDPNAALAGYKIGVGPRASSKMIVDGATVNVSTNARFAVGALSAGNLDMLSGTVNTKDFILGHGGNVIATQSGGAVNATNVWHYDGGNATNTMTGGTLTTRRIFNFTAAANIFTLILNGGVVQAAPGTVRLMDNGGRSGQELDVQLGTTGATIDTSLSDATIARPLDNVPAQTGRLTKIGTGMLTLSSNNTYTGGTTVSNGTLLVNAALASSTVTVVSGATFGGAGTIAGTVTLDSGATLAPGGNAIGTLTLSSALNLVAGNTTFVKVAGGGSSSDTVVTPAVQFAGTLTVSNSGGSFVGGETYALFSAGSYTGDFSATNLPALSPGLSWNWDAATGTLSVVGSAAVITVLADNFTTADSTNLNNDLLTRQSGVAATQTWATVQLNGADFAIANNSISITNTGDTSVTNTYGVVYPNLDFKPYERFGSFRFKVNVSPVVTSGDSWGAVKVRQSDPSKWLLYGDGLGLYIRPAGSWGVTDGSSVKFTGNVTSNATYVVELEVRTNQLWAKINGVAIVSGYSLAATQTVNYVSLMSNAGNFGGGSSGVAATFDDFEFFVMGTNAVPVAGADSLAWGKGASNKYISITNLLSNDTDADGDTLTLIGVDATSANGVALTTNGSYIEYNSALTANDSFNYTISDGFGGTASGLVSITATNSYSQSGEIAATPTNATAVFYGIPGTNYYVLRATNVLFTLGVSNFPYAAAATNGVVQVVDDFADLPGVPASAFYRLFVY